MYIVFGGSGFIGKHLTTYLIKKYGKQKIYCINRKKTICKNLKKIDLSKKKINFNIRIKSFKIAYILSADSRIVIGNKKEEKKQIKKNKIIINNIIKILKKLNIKNIVYFNSSSIYSFLNKKPFTENQKLNPVIALGKSKLYGEQKLCKYSRRSRIKFISLRIFTVYGPGMNKNQFISQAIKKFYSKKKNITFWNPNTKRSFIYINDLIRILDKVISINYKKELILNVGSFSSYKVKEVINIISKISKIKKNINFLNSKNNLDHVPSYENLKKIIKNNFNFTSLSKGLRQTIYDFKKNKKM